MGWYRIAISYHRFAVPESFEIKSFFDKSFGNKFTWSELITVPHKLLWGFFKFYLVLIFIHFVVEMFCCQMLPLTFHEYYAIHMVYSFYYLTKIWKTMKHDLEALDKGYDSLNYFYCTYVRIFESRSICLQVKS